MIEMLALAFGMLATLLAGVGLYGVLSYTTMQRTREIGIRMALGSTRLAITGLVVKEMVRLGLIGVVVAVPCAMLLGRALRSQLFGVSAADPLTLTGVVLLMGVVGLAAALVPARRAANVEPMEALRAESALRSELEAIAAFPWMAAAMDDAGLRNVDDFDELCSCEFAGAPRRYAFLGDLTRERDAALGGRTRSR
jgi:predicted lysophospholipase L1 biosynthesis ABC-type transport system permease subunit